MRTGIAAVLIVKNEEETLGRCLKSLQELDQIVVLDTGSDDGTLAIARQGGAEVYVGKKRDPFHFAEARNEALEHVRARWAISIDADEVLREGSVSALRKATAMTGETAFRSDFHDFAPGSDVSFTCRRLRVFRSERWVWSGRIHEELVGTSKSSIAGVGDLGPAFSIEHRPKPLKDGRRKQNLALINLTMTEEPHRVDLWKKMGGEMLLRGQWDDSIYFLQEFIRQGQGIESAMDMSETLIQLGQAYAGAGKLDDAIASFREANRLAPDRREPLWHAYLELMKKNRLLDALYYLEQVLRIDPSRRPQFWLNLEPVWGNLPVEALAYCKGQIDQALGAEKAQDFWASWEAQKNLPPVVAK